MAGSAQEFQKQLVYYQRKYELNPRSRIFAPLADTLRKSGRIDEALELLKSGLLDHPRYVSALVILGRCHTDAGHQAAARDAFLRVLELDPDNLVALKYLAGEAARREDWTEATGLLQRVVALDPSDGASEDQLARLRDDPRTRPHGAGASRTADSLPGDQGDAPGAAGVDFGEVSPGNQFETAVVDDDKEFIDKSLDNKFDKLAEETPALPEVLAQEDQVVGTAGAEPYAAAEVGTAAAAEVPAKSAADEEVLPLEELGADVPPTDLAAQSPESAPVTGPLTEPAVPPQSRKQTIAEPINHRSLATKTLADIYMAQGYRDKALAVLRQILERHPEREDIREQITQIEASPAPSSVEAARGEEPLVPSPAVDSALRRQLFENWLEKIRREAEE